VRSSHIHTIAREVIVIFTDPRSVPVESSYIHYLTRNLNRVTNPRSSL